MVSLNETKCIRSAKTKMKKKLDSLRNLPGCYKVITISFAARIQMVVKVLRSNRILAFIGLIHCRHRYSLCRLGQLNLQYYDYRVVAVMFWCEMQNERHFGGFAFDFG